MKQGVLAQVKCCPNTDILQVPEVAHSQILWVSLHGITLHLTDMLSYIERSTKFKAARVYPYPQAMAHPDGAYAHAITHVHGIVTACS